MEKKVKIPTRSQNSVFVTTSTDIITYLIPHQNIPQRRIALYKSGILYLISFRKIYISVSNFITSPIHMPKNMTVAVGFEMQDYVNMINQRPIDK